MISAKEARAELEKVEIEIEATEMKSNETLRLLEKLGVFKDVFIACQNEESDLVRFYSINKVANSAMLCSQVYEVLEMLGYNVIFCEISPNVDPSCQLLGINIEW